MGKYTERLEYLVGEETIRKLKDKHVLVCGAGGVGSFVAEALARSGVGHLTLLDFDTVDPSNLNRQLMTNKRNIGEPKVEALKQRIEEVSDAEVRTLSCFIDRSYTPDLDYDYVLDCIDTLTAKFQLVKRCHERNIPVISSLGSARRIRPENIRLTTLDKTRNDPLAKAFRELVKKERYHKKIEVVFTDSPAIKTDVYCEEGKTMKERHPLGSSVFVVGSVGLYIASVVFSRLCERQEQDIV